MTLIELIELVKNSNLADKTNMTFSAVKVYKDDKSVIRTNTSRTTKPGYLQDVIMSAAIHIDLTDIVSFSVKENSDDLLLIECELSQTKSRFYCVNMYFQSYI